MIFYHGTSEENWKEIQGEGMLFGRRFLVNNNGDILKEFDRCTYLAYDLDEAKCYGDVVLEVEYNPFNRLGNIKKDKNNLPLNNYIPDGWQLRVYEPIPLENIKRIK